MNYKGFQADNSLVFGIVIDLSLDAVESILSRLGEKIAGIPAAINNAFSKTADEIKSLPDTIDNVMTKANNGLAQFIPGMREIKSFAPIALGAYFVSTMKETMDANKSLRDLIDNNQEYADAQAFLQKTSMDLAVDLNTLTRGYKSLLDEMDDTAAAKNLLEGFATALQKEPSNVLEESLSSLSEILSGTTVQMADLEKISDVMPDFFHDVAAATGMTEESFKKLTEAGQMSTQLFQSGLTIALQNYNAENTGVTNNLAAQFTRLRNQFTMLQGVLEQPFREIITPTINYISVVIGKLITFIQSGTTNATNSLKGGSTAFTELGRNIQQIVEGIIKLMVPLFKILYLILPTIQLITTSLAGFAAWVVNLIGEHKNLIIVLGTIISLVMFLGRMQMAYLISQFVGFSRILITIGAYLGTLTAFSFAGLVASFGALALKTVAFIQVLQQLIAVSLVFMATPLGLALAAAALAFGALYYWNSKSNEELEATTAAAKKTSETLKEFRDTISYLKDVGVGNGVVKSIEQIRAATMAGRLSQEEGLRQAKAIADAVRAADEKRKVQIEQTENDIQQKREALNEKLTELGKLETERQERNEKAKAEAAEKSLSAIFEGRMRFDDKIYQSAKLTAEKIVDLEKQATDRIKELHQSLADEKMSVEDKIREMRRKEMADYDAQADLEAQINEKMAAARAMLDTGNTAKAQEMAEQIKSLVGNVTDTTKAISLLEGTSQIVQDSISQNISEVEKFKTKLGTETDKKSVEQIKVEADTAQATQEIDKLLRKVDALKDKDIKINVHQVLDGYKLKSATPASESVVKAPDTSKAADESSKKSIEASAKSIEASESSKEADKSSEEADDSSEEADKSSEEADDSSEEDSSSEDMCACLEKAQADDSGEEDTGGLMKDDTLLDKLGAIMDTDKSSKEADDSSEEADKSSEEAAVKLTAALEAQAEDLNSKLEETLENIADKMTVSQTALLEQLVQEYNDSTDNSQGGEAENVFADIIGVLKGIDAEKTGSILELDKQMQDVITAMQEVNKTSEEADDSSEEADDSSEEADESSKEADDSSEEADKSSEEADETVKEAAMKLMEAKSKDGSESDAIINVVVNSEEALAEIARLEEELDKLKNTPINIALNGAPNLMMATGGHVPGIGNTDTVPAMLTPGEFVTTKARSQRFLPVLNFMNFAPLDAVENFIATRAFQLGGLVESLPHISIPNMPVLKFGDGGTVPSITPAPAQVSAPVETIRLEWSIGNRSGSVETLMSQRQQLNSLVNAINEAARGL